MKKHRFIWNQLALEFEKESTCEAIYDLGAVNCMKESDNMCKSAHKVCETVINVCVKL
jgi:hypothetical protein